MKNNKDFDTVIKLIIIAIISTIFGCKNVEKQKNFDEITATDNINEETLYRPNFYFTPKANRMNDPNKMTYH